MENLTNVGKTAFFNCKKLKSFAFGDVKQKKKMGDRAFCGCTSLERVENLDGLDKIPAMAFLDCESLKEIIIPEGCTLIDELAFDRCKKLEEVAQGILRAMGEENVSKITIGMGCNDISHLLNSKVYNKVKAKPRGFSDEDVKRVFVAHMANMLKGKPFAKREDIIERFNDYVFHLKDCDRKALEAGCPIDYVTEEVRDDGDDFIKEVYTDSRLEVGQVLLWENLLYKKSDEEKEIQQDVNTRNL